MLRITRKVLLLVEALICFGGPIVLLVSGVPLLLTALQPLRLELSPGGFGIAVLLLFVGGLLGVIGAGILVLAALGSSKPLRYPKLTLLFICSGAAALAAAGSWLDVVGARVLLLALVGTLHFLYISRASFARPTSAGAESRTRAVLVDIAVAVLVIAPVVSALAYRINSTGLPVAQETDPCTRFFGSGVRASFAVDIREADWPIFTGALAEFARDAGLTFYDGSRRYDAMNLLYLSMCNDQGTRVFSTEQHYRTGPEWDWTPDDGVSVPVYGVDNSSDWRLIADALHRKLDATWPGKVMRTDRAPAGAP